MIHFLLGGARSGKSKRGVQLCNELGARLNKPKLFVATAQAFDDEMVARIGLHQGERDASWGLSETPLALAALISKASQPEILLVDCLTLWLSNAMLGDLDVGAYSDELLDALSTTEATIFLVSNEVGMGLVPETKLGRDFRDAQGRLNQKVAAIADVVEFVVAGLPLKLKG